MEEEGQLSKVQPRELKMAPRADESRHCPENTRETGPRGRCQWALLPAGVRAVELQGRLRRHEWRPHLAGRAVDHVALVGMPEVDLGSSIGDTGTQHGRGQFPALARVVQSGRAPTVMACFLPAHPAVYDSAGDSMTASVKWLCAIKVAARGPPSRAESRGKGKPCVAQDHLLPSSPLHD